MAKCKCGRQLEPGEDICPACKSTKHWWIKKSIEGIALVVVIVIGALSGGRGGGSNT
jgi:hypothetical protein